MVCKCFLFDFIVQLSSFSRISGKPSEHLLKSYTEVNACILRGYHHQND